MEGRKGTLSIDLAPRALFRRSFRKKAGVAPLKENVAAAILLRAGWPLISKNGGAFIDLMCGSGTFLFEALLIAGEIAPGAYHADDNPGAWSGHNKTMWHELVSESRERRRQALASALPRIIGYDIDKREVENCLENVRRAGLLKQISAGQADFHTVRFPVGGAGSGLVIANPPYGWRMDKERNLPGLYNDLGRVLSKEFSGYKAAILAGDKRLAKAIGLQAEKLHTIYNGPLRCTLAHFKLSRTNKHKLLTERDE
jgi:23S rRNA (guanine2445-N2)-methyltransferase / 23S rRNA (guanine2069-N7)-methyltransferase